MSSGDSWQIFYADTNNVYLISKDYMPGFIFCTDTNIIGSSAINYITNDGKPYSTLLNDSERFPAANKWLKCYIDPTTNTWYTSSDKNVQKNIQATMYMLDSKNVWNEYINDYADWAIGGPTMELLAESYNKIKKYNADKLGNSYTNFEITGVSALGYPWQSGYISATNVDIPWENGYNYWSAAPSNNYWERMIWVDTRGNTCGNNGYSYIPYFRPIVCLKSENILKWNNSTNMYDIQ